jgi:peptidoglycan/xylan/chitin deacetylase (PgdA/CDA1 family)
MKAPSTSTTSPSGLGAWARGAARSAVQSLLPEAVIVWSGPRTLRRVALTFDDGPTTMTRAYLDELDRCRARVTFFTVGQMCAKRRDDLLEIVRRGHEVAGHGYLHERFTDMSRATLEGELSRTAALLPPVPSARPLVRPPHGAFSVSSLATSAAAGYRTVLWSLDSNDCRTEDPAHVTRSILSAARPGDIVLLHEEQRWTLDAIAPTVEGLRADGFDLVTVSELLAG